MFGFSRAHFQKCFLTTALCLILFVSGCTNSSKGEISLGCSDVLSPCLNGIARVEMITNRGSFLLELDGESAPVTAGNFLDLVNRGVYDGTIFHRVIREPVPFVVQGGDPTTKNSDTPEANYGTGNFFDEALGKPRFIPLELKLRTRKDPLYGSLVNEPNDLAQLELTHQRGALAMARSQAVNSASAQFYISLRNLPELDGRYSVFGRVVKGMEVVDKIAQGDSIIKASYLQSN
ncbi:peptidylprolyl isomerase [Prochlorococcus sp. MIT 1300]|uniref:peptidylprolyl isomerase n=1 Tax=Prochlorococcus sp. MIT 1300 TaxID=3096218 RepID=UPI002A74F23F|nr:peptidylprolyl isomerase [Prochlorococcus sp. MIT 1300]